MFIEVRTQEKEDIRERGGFLMQGLTFAFIYLLVILVLRGEGQGRREQ